MCNFRVGQKVVCINDADGESHWLVPTVGDMDGLTRGCVYTVREIYFDVVWAKTLVRLEEIRRPPCLLDGQPFECGFYPERFRPVVDRKTDISIFTAMLTDTKVEEPA